MREVDQAYVVLQSWVGRTSHKVAILEDRTHQYLVRWDDLSVFGRFIRGTVRKVPKSCVIIKKEKVE